MHDNEFPEAVAELVTKLGEYWRGSVLKREDGELGLGYTTADGDTFDEATHGGAASRAALLRLFEMLAPRLECEAPDYGQGKAARFNFQTRKRRSNAEVAAEKAALAATKAAGKASKAAAKAAKDADKAAKAAERAAKAPPKKKAATAASASSTASSSSATSGASLTAAVDVDGASESGV